MTPLVTSVLDALVLGMCSSVLVSATRVSFLLADRLHLVRNILTTLGRRLVWTWVIRSVFEVVTCVWLVGDSVVRVTRLCSSGDLGASAVVLTVERVVAQATVTLSLDDLRQR